MTSLSIAEMQRMQRELQEKYKHKWGGLYPQKGRDMLLWMIGEAGEVADVIKRNGDEKIMKDDIIRGSFIEEMCDVLMCFNDVMLCYHIAPEEIEKRYIEKHRVNMDRW